MKIVYNKINTLYYDMNGDQIHKGDIVKICGRYMRVFQTEQGYLGTDATNPAWIKSGRAAEGEMGIYPFDEYDEPIIAARAGEYKRFDAVKEAIEF